MNWRTLERKTLLDHGRYLTVEEHVVQLPDGRTITDWPWLITPDYVDVVATTISGEVICLRQGKYAIDGDSLAPVGGFIEPGEGPLAAAQRELLEETGYSSEHWQHLGSFAVDGNRGAGVAHMFLAEGCAHQQWPASDDLEEQQVVLVRYDQLREQLLLGKVKVLPWVAAMALALLHLAPKE